MGDGLVGLATTHDISLCAAIEAGGTHTRVGLFDGTGRCIARAEGPGANPVANSRARAVRVVVNVLQEIVEKSGRPLGNVAGAIAGLGDAEGRAAFAAALFAQFDIHRIILSGDAQPILLANRRDVPAILAVAGTGSIVIGAHHDEILTIGGRGALCGEEGGAYGVAMDGIRAAGYALDGMGPATGLTDALPAAAGLDSFDRLCRWPHAQSKEAVAALAREVTRAAEQGDTVAQRIVDHQAGRLARQVESARNRFADSGSVDVFFIGGLFERSPIYRDAFLTAMDYRVRGATCSVPGVTGPEAVARCARLGSLPDAWFNVFTRNQAAISIENEAPTESHDDDVSIDVLEPLGLVRHMALRDSDLTAIVAAEAEPIAEVVDAAATAIESGRRIYYVGAGTSGRLGVLDASECPPTFGIAPERVVGIIAGGEAALHTSAEGAEDDRDAGCAAMEAVEEGDVVVGIAASGRTPYTLSALEEARAKGAFTALLCCNPLAVCPAARVHIALDTGPEIVAGSTRLRAGTATKMTLNIISTGALALAGYVHDGYMVGVQATNEKLRARAVGIVETLGGCDATRAAECLKEAEMDVRVAILIASSSKALTNRDGQMILASCGGRLRKALQVI